MSEGLYEILKRWTMVSTQKFTRVVDGVQYAIVYQSGTWSLWRDYDNKPKRQKLVHGFTTSHKLKEYFEYEGIR